MLQKEVMKQTNVIITHRKEKSDSKSTIIIDDVKEFLLTHLVKAKDHGRYISSLCPFHGENDPSFAVYMNSLSYKCFACGAHGKIETLLKHLGYNKKIDKINNTEQNNKNNFTVFTPDQVDEADLQKKSESYFYNLHRITPLDALRGYKVIPSSLHQYWLNRGISLKTIIDLGIGCGEDKRGFFYSVPFFWLDDKIHTVAIKKIYPKQAKNGTKDSYGLYPEGISIPLYNQPALMLAKKQHKPLIIFEGEKDAIMGMDRGYLGVAVAGKGVFKDTYIPLFREIPELLIWLDNDAVPEMQEIAKKFHNMKNVYDDLPKIKIFDWSKYNLPKGGDFTDLIRGGLI